LQSPLPRFLDQLFV